MAQRRTGSPALSHTVRCGGAAGAIVLAETRQAGGYRRGMAARLAHKHGGSERSWQRAMTEARVVYERERATAGR